MALKIENGTLTANEFIELSKSVGWGKDRIYNMTKVARALKDTSFTVVVRDDSGRAVGCGRVFSDDLLMTFIPDIFVHPDYQRMGVGRMIIEEIKKKYAFTSFFFGAQPGNEPFFEKLGFTKSMQSYAGKFAENPHFK